IMLIAAARYLVKRFSRGAASDGQGKSDAGGRKNDLKNDRKNERFRVSPNDAFSMSLVQIIVMMFPLYVIGRNDGAFLSYFLQLWIPFITVVALVSFERMGRGIMHAAVYAGIAAFTIYFGFARLPLHVLTADEMADWQKAYGYTQKFAEQGEIFYARSLAYDPTADDVTSVGGDCICGHDGEISPDTITALTGAGLPDSLTKYARRIVDQNLSYREKVQQKAKDHVYSLITFDKCGAYTLFDEAMLEEAGYRCIDRIDLQVGNMPYEVLFYVPH
ncbi:MAG: hypothetical protein IKQ40_01780, partial [Lachnospiraceae bacterium]|nr:hypothetical protein [Lachnospiraceae bacterium]